MNKIQKWMNAYDRNYFEAGYYLWKDLDMSKLPKLQAYIRNRRIDDILI